MFWLLIATSLAQAGGIDCDGLRGLLAAGVAPHDVVNALDTAGVDPAAKACMMALKPPPEVLDFLVTGRADPAAGPQGDAEVRQLAGVTYALVTGTQLALSQKVAISIDYGATRSHFSDTYLRTEASRLARFVSMADVMNYMSDQGWEFVSAYAFEVDRQIVYHYIYKHVGGQP